MSNELKLLTLIFDEALTKQIEQDLIALGAKGYTISFVHGRGQTGERVDSWSGTNVKLETVAADEVVKKILEHLRVKYFHKYPMIGYYNEVSVIRSSHFI